jgi:hypothetical protein
MIFQETKRDLAAYDREADALIHEMLNAEAPPSEDDR